MKFGTLFCAIALSASMAAGVGVALSSTLIPDSVSVQAGDGSVPSGIYVDIENCQWKSWSATLSDVKAHFFNGGTGYDTWPGTAVSSVAVNGTTYGYVSVPSGATQVIFNAWGGKADKEKTVDLTIPTDGKCLFKVTSYNTDSAQTGTWSNLEQRYTAKPTTASSSTGRVIAFNSNAHSDWQTATIAVRAWGGSASQANNSSHSFVSASTYLIDWFNGGGSDSRWYGIADIPTNVTSYQFVRLSGASSSAVVWSYSDSLDLSDSSFSCVHYLNADSTDHCPVSTGRADSVGAALATRIIAARNTCNSSVHNGYGAFTNLNNNFFKQLTDGAKTTSCKSLGGSTNFTVQQHVDFMQSKSNAPAGAFPLAVVENKNIVSVIAVVSIITAASVAGFFYFRKRKHI